MKKCNNCGAYMEDQKILCGTADVMQSQQQSVNSTGGTSNLQLDDQVQAYPPVYQITNVSAEDAGEDGNGNILAGVVGALLFSLGGGILYFIIYQIGFIAGICGLVIFVLANLGYSVFARTKNKASKVALIVSIAVTIVMIFLSEYISLSFEAYKVFKDYYGSAVSIFKIIRFFPKFLSDADIAKLFIHDLLFAYAFGFLATIGNIVNLAKQGREKQ